MNKKNPLDGLNHSCVLARTGVYTWDVVLALFGFKNAAGVAILDETPADNALIESWMKKIYHGECMPSFRPDIKGGILLDGSEASNNEMERLYNEVTRVRLENVTHSLDLPKRRRFIIRHPDYESIVCEGLTAKLSLYPKSGRDGLITYIEGLNTSNVRLGTRALAADSVIKQIITFDLVDTGDKHINVDSVKYEQDAIILNLI